VVDANGTLLARAGATLTVIAAAPNRDQ